MSTQTFILTGKTRAALEGLLADIEPIAAEACITESSVPATLEHKPHIEKSPARALVTTAAEGSALRNRQWAMRDYPAPHEGLVAILGAAIASWETEASSVHTELAAATTFRACAWELRQILRDFPVQSANSTSKEQKR